MEEFEAALKNRDKRLRRKAIVSLKLAMSSPRGGMSGQSLMDGINEYMPPGDNFENEQHALTIFRSLKSKGLVTETEQKGRRRGQPFSVAWLFYEITAKGESLWNESIDADPDIDDDRI